MCLVIYKVMLFTLLTPVASRCDDIKVQLLCIPCLPLYSFHISITGKSASHVGIFSSLDEQHSFLTMT